MNHTWEFGEADPHQVDMSPGWHKSVFPLIALVFCAVTAVAEDGANKPQFLVARPGLPNALFEKSVILMLPADDQNRGLIVGLIVNKPTRRKLAELFPKQPALRDRSDTVYFGGPVDLGTPRIVFRAPKPSEKAIHVFDDVYVSFDADFVVELLKEAKPDESVRVFLGRAQWGATQLQNEMLLHAWYSERAESSLIFSQNPQDLWRTLIGREQPGPMAWLLQPRC